MDVSPGARIGPYEIVAPLGRGGMGQVYRARDSRLGRDVAFKVLHADRAGSPEWRRRFEDEARAASRLNHPNILTVHDVGDTDGTLYLVAELVDGESLRAQLRRGPLPIQELLSVAAQVADGLAAAHAAGITHRDLKPENVMITREGRAKIVDFGLARLSLPAGLESVETGTVQQGATAAGVILGTVAYMSPEQARGSVVDYRSDQFSFGCMLYEMATGTRPFDRADAMSTLAAILHDDPPSLAATHPSLPPPLRWLMERCLAKDPARRFAATSDLRDQLADLRDRGSELRPQAAERVVAVPPRPRWIPAIAMSVAALLGGAAVSALVLLSARDESAVPRFTPFATEAADESQPAWSPDGRTLAYVAVVDNVAQVFTRAVGATAAARITNAESDCQFPFWSPTGSRIYYESDAVLWSVGAAGGPSVPVIDRLASRDIASAAISPDGGTIAAVRVEAAGQSLYLVNPDGSDSRRVDRPPFPVSPRVVHGVSYSPDGGLMMALVIQRIEPGRGFEVWLLPSGDRAPYQVATTLPLDVRPISQSWMPDNRHVVLSVEPDEGAGHHLYRLDTQTGTVHPLTSGSGAEQHAAVSPDGARIAYTSGSPDWDLVETRLDTARITPVLSTSRSEREHSFSPLANEYVYVSTARGPAEVWIRAADGGQARVVASPDRTGTLFRARPRFSPSGDRLALSRIGEGHRVFVAHLAGGPAVPIDAGTDDQHGSAWSPDGEWIAFCRFAGSAWELARAPSGGGTAVALRPGCDALGLVEWSPQGNRIASSDRDGLHLIAPDGQDVAVTPLPNVAGLAFSRDGREVYALHGSSRAGWTISAVDASNGREKRATRLAVPAGSDACCLSLHPDGQRLGFSLATTRRDIWIADGLIARHRGLPGLFRRQ